MTKFSQIDFSDYSAVFFFKIEFIWVAVHPTGRDIDIRTVIQDFLQCSDAFGGFWREVEVIRGDQEVRSSQDDLRYVAHDPETGIERQVDMSMSPTFQFGIQAVLFLRHVAAIRDYHLTAGQICLNGVNRVEQLFVPQKSFYPKADLVKHFCSNH